jgi:Got1/Sft2-like family
MSFGKWYDEQKASEGGDGSSNSWFGDLTSGEQLLPLYEGMQPISFQNIRETMEAQMPKKIMGMNYQQRFKVFTALLLLSALFFALAFGVGMPMITFRPQKFAISFTMGSLLFMGSFGILKGPYEHVKSMCTGDRMFFTTIYVGSMLATLYFTFNVGGPQGYVIVLFASGVQLLALLYYLVSFLPGGATGMRILMAAMCQMLKPVLMVCAKFQAICMARCCSFILRRR